MVSDLYALIGMEYLFLDQFDNARIYFSKCLELDPTLIIRHYII